MDDRKIRSLPDSPTRMITDGTLQREYSNLLLKEPVNPNISPSARALLSYLYQLQGKAIISGQHEYLESPNQFSPYIFSVTGKYPKLKGVEFGAINGQSDQTTYNQRANVVNACKDWVLNKGGIITATYHATFPGTANTWANVQADCTPEQFEPIITPGTDLYNALIEDIDQVAVHLKALRDANVPVLWRPYHEMNGTWFWWGGQPKFNNLWEIMYNRYVNVHGLNNLLWVWSPNANNQWCQNAADFYVGHNRADALGMDIYNNDFRAWHHQELLRIGEGRIIAITENGQNPDPTTLRQKQYMYSWFMTWGSYVKDGSRNPADKLQALYNDPFVLTLDEQYPPENAVYPPDTSIGNGLWGDYYVGPNFEKYYLGKTVPTIDYNWMKGTPVGNYSMSIKWAGYLRPRFTEDYTLYTKASDGVRLYLDNRLLLDDWTVHSTQEHSVTIRLEAGKYYFIELHYFNGGDPEAAVSLSWSSPSQPKEVIPQSQLYTG
ncbi:glycosyl hydrolase [Paenibacillus sp. 7124]|uniref:Glycosyl hydrolase n=1 Tax=Paenibacillus apii TaxID=1850370 RepID=A0A6M1PPZ9_9BACL|nr:glycosyl hydrolase [Paenibacillus apii]NGM84434.1 glycosyl hydrolase [Paenibacillus apii]